MFVKPGDVVRFEAYFQAAATGLGVSGLTVKVAVNNGTTATAITVASSTSASELDSTNQPGWYYYNYTVPSGYYGTLEASFTTTDTSVSQRGGASLYISALWLVYAAQQYRDSNLVQILGTTLTETAGYLAAGFKKLLNIATPVFTVASVNQGGDNFARIGAAGAGLTALGDTRIANLDATITSRMATFTYTTPPTAAQNRTEMDANSTKLASIDTAAGTTLPGLINALNNFDPATDVVAHVTLVDTTTDLTNGGGGTDPWVTVLPNGYTSGQAGNILGNLRANLSASGVTVTTPVLESGDIEIHAGDDYFAVDGRALVWTLTNAPDLTGATVRFVTRGLTVVATVAGSVITVELTNAQTAPMSGCKDFELEATLADGHIISLLRGSMDVRMDIG